MNMDAIATTMIRGSPDTAGPVREPQQQNRPVEAVTQTEAAPTEQTDPDPDALAQTLEGVNGLLALGTNHVQFAMHEDAGIMMVKVIDNATSEVIKTIPSKELLDLAAKFGELVGTLMDEKG